MFESLLALSCTMRNCGGRRCRRCLGNSKRRLRPIRSGRRCRLLLPSMAGCTGLPLKRRALSSSRTLTVQSGFHGRFVAVHQGFTPMRPWALVISYQPMGCSENVSAEVSSSKREVVFSTLHSMPGRQFFRMALPAGIGFDGVSHQVARFRADGKECGVGGTFSSSPSTVSALIVVLSRVASVATVRVRGCLKRHLMGSLKKGALTPIVSKSLSGRGAGFRCGERFLWGLVYHHKKANGPSMRAAFVRTLAVSA